MYLSGLHVVLLGLHVVGLVDGLSPLEIAISLQHDFDDGKIKENPEVHAGKV